MLDDRIDVAGWAANQSNSGESVQVRLTDTGPDGSLTPLPTGCKADGSQTNTSFYACPSGLGIVTHTIGSPRQIQMALHFDF